MYAERSASQILYGHLPGQTVDLNGGIWRVTEWRSPKYLRVDTTALREELIRLARPWETSERDGRFVKRLREGREIRVNSLDLYNGISVERYPEIYQCRVCNRIVKSRSGACVCGATSWGQLHFVGYHDCGAIEEPFIRRCPKHDQAKLIFPGSTDVGQIKVVCPVCNIHLQRGLGTRACECGRGVLTFNVHRAASVFSPRSFAIVNPLSEEKLAEIRVEGGPDRALAWVLQGLPRAGMGSTAVDAEALIETLVRQGLSREFAEQTAAAAKNEGQIDESAPSATLGPLAPRALSEATTIYTALSESRRTVNDLIDGTDNATTIGRKYRGYLLWLLRAGLDGLELVDRFPVLSGHFGYTRGSFEPGKATLRTWKDQRTSQQAVYAELQETEALFVRLDPQRVAAWLRSRGHDLPSTVNDKDARRAILERAAVPEPGEELDHTTLGSDLLTLIHSYAHRFVRQAAVFAGLDRNSLSELLVPLHLGFFVYAAARGDFVLGGLQAVFETDLDGLLERFVRDEHRCALDPGCSGRGGACVACLHLGEPSCRFFNRYLDRSALGGSVGYLHFDRADSA